VNDEIDVKADWAGFGRRKENGVADSSVLRGKRDRPHLG